MLLHQVCGARYQVERSAVMTAIASNIHRFGPALRPRETSREEVSSPAVSASWPFPEPVRPSVHWDELEWWTKQLGRPLDAA
jgi:hypothetical protein